MKEIARQLVMLKPMQAGVSGYARLQGEKGSTLFQLHLRGLSCQAVQVFWYSGGGETRQLGRATVSPRGEACLTAEAPGERVAPERLQALLVLDGGQPPRPLMIGLCARQSAGSLLDAKNASLALCERLGRVGRERAEGEPKAGGKPGPALRQPEERESPERPATGGADTREAESPRAAAGPSAPAPVPAPGISAPAPGLFAGQKAKAGEAASAGEEIAAQGEAAHEKKPGTSAWLQDPAFPPREIFLPAIDPLPYVAAEAERAPLPEPQGAKQPPQEACRQMPEKPRPAALPVDALERLRWPETFAPLREYFDRLLPCAPLELPGWRFVCVSRQGDGLWIGYLAVDGAVRKVAYVMRGPAPAGDRRPYQMRRGIDGAPYRTLVQRAM